MKTIWTVVICAVVTAGVVGGGTYYLANAKAMKDKDKLQSQITDLNKKVADTEKSLADAKATTTTQTTAQTTSSTVSTVANDTADWKTYTNETLGFSFRYPNSWNDITLEKSTPTITQGSNNKGSLYSLGNASPAGTFADPDKVFDFSLYSRDYTVEPVFVAYSRPVDLNFTKDQFDKEVHIYGKSLGFSKIDNKGIFTLAYGAPECSPGMSMKVYIPTTNPAYPNLIISVNSGFESDSSIKAFEQEQQAANSDACDQQTVYQAIADKVMAETYSDKVAQQKQILESITKSFSNL